MNGEIKSGGPDGVLPWNPDGSLGKFKKEPGEETATDATVRDFKTEFESNPSGLIAHFDELISRAEEEIGHIPESLNHEIFNFRTNIRTVPGFQDSIFFSKYEELRHKIDEIQEKDKKIKLIRGDREIEDD